MVSGLTITPVKDGLLLLLRVSAGGSRAGILGIHGDRLKIAVRQAPERGKANKAVLSLLAEALGIQKADLEIRTGAGAPSKTVLVRGLSADNLRHLIELALPGD